VLDPAEIPRATMLASLAAFASATPVVLRNNGVSSRAVTCRRPRSAAAQQTLAFSAASSVMRIAVPGGYPDVAVIGGGAAGLSTAVAVALSGASVTVLSRAPDEAALLAAAGMLAPNSESLAPCAMADLAAASRAMYPAYVDLLQRITGDDLRYVSRGDFLYPLLDGQQAPSSVSRVGKYVGRDALRHIEAALGPAVTGAYEIPGDARVDNRALFAALRKACDVLGVNVVEGAEVVNVVASPNGKVVDRLVLASGDAVLAGHYVAATGAWTQKLLPGVPMRPVKGQMLCLEPGNRSQARDEAMLQHLLFGRDVYVVPKNRNQFYVGATVEDVGFDREVTAGGVSSLLSKVVEMVPSFAGYRLVESWAGLRPSTPDRLPVLGMSSFSNMSIASGYYRNGVLLTPAGSTIAAAVALGREATLEPVLRSALDNFSCSRFLDAPAGMTSATASNESERAPKAVRAASSSSPAAVQAPTAKDSPPSSHAALDALAEETGEEILMFKINADGTRQPIRRGQTPEMFMQGAGDIAGEEEAIRAAELAAELKRRTGISVPALPLEEGKGGYINDAYDDILAMRGREQEATMRDAMAKNRSFGVEQRPGHENQFSSLTPGEWDTLDTAFAAGLEDASSLGSEFEELAAEVRSRVSSSWSSQETSHGAPEDSATDETRDHKGLNGFRMQLFGNGRSPKQD
jgi:glycine oxidase